MSGNDDKLIVAVGERATVRYAVRQDGSIPAWEFFEGLPHKSQAKFMVWFQMLADEGFINNLEIFRRERGGFYAFKVKGPQRQMYRIACKRHGNIWFLLHGFIKPRQSQWTEQANNLNETIWEECNPDNQGSA